MHYMADMSYADLEEGHITMGAVGVEDCVLTFVKQYNSIHRGILELGNTGVLKALRLLLPCSSYRFYTSSY